MIEGVRLACFVSLAVGCGPPKEPVPFDSGFHLDAGDFDAGDPAACTAREPGDPGIVFGSGEAEWLEVEDGDDIPFVHGPQGLHHFYGSVRERNIDTSDAAIVAFAVFDGKEQINDGLGVYARPGTWTPSGDGWRATLGYVVEMNVEEAVQIDGHTVCVVVRVKDASDVEYLDERTIRLFFDGEM